MIPHSLVIDHFLPDLQGWREWADTATYEDVVNPLDGVSYPGICKDVPAYGTRKRLESVMGSAVRINTIFTRLSLAGVPVPHQAHTDAVMGQFSLMVYLNRAEHCRGGTSLVRHVNGMDRNPLDEEQRMTWERDTNIPEMWKPYSMCNMQPNRAFIFQADLMHRAEPIGGFGDSPENGRLVLTAFFDL